MARRWKLTRPRTRGRRLRHGTVERPLNARLVRVGFLVVIPAFLAFLFSISTTARTSEALPLDPLFDGESAATFAETLAVDPSRVPGSEGAAREPPAGTERPSRPSVSGPRRTSGQRTSLTSERSSCATSSRSCPAGPTGSRSRCSPGQRGSGASTGRTRPEPRRSSNSRAVSRRRTSVLTPCPSTHSCSSRRTQAPTAAPRPRFVAESPHAADAIAVIVLDDLGRGRPRLALQATTLSRPLARWSRLRRHG